MVIASFGNDPGSAEAVDAVGAVGEVAGAVAVGYDVDMIEGPVGEGDAAVGLAEAVAVTSAAGVLATAVATLVAAAMSLAL